MDVNERVQIQVFVKSLSYDRNLNGGNLLILSATDFSVNRSNITAVIETADRDDKLIKNSFTLIPVGRTFLGKDDLKSALADAETDLVYLCDDLSEKMAAEIADVCSERGLLTITGVADLVKKGYVSLSAVKESKTAKPILNTTRVKQEKHFFAYSFQKICRVVDSFPASSSN